MKFEITRRDVMRFAGGAVVGTALSPMPWMLTDDLAIWTQNWSWIPKPPQGAHTSRPTVCALCPAACALDAHCVGKALVALGTSGTLYGPCTLGLTGHHLPWHPARIDRPVRQARGDARPATVTLDAAVRETADALSRARAGAGAVVALDTRPGRSSSWAWRRLLAGIDGASVVAAPGLEGSALDALASLSGDASRPTALDLSGACTLLSFGAPVAEGWGRLRDTCRDEIRLTQVEPFRSRSAELADRWLPARPGTEGALALGIANVLIAEGHVDRQLAESISDFEAYAAIAARFPVERVAAMTGLSPADIVATAHELATNGPSVVIAGEQPASGSFGPATDTAILGLNLLLGGASRLVARAEIPAPREGEPLASTASIHDLPDRSIALLLIDASSADVPFPWPLVERKLAKGSLVVALSQFLSGTARHADLVVPAAPFLETLHEIPSPASESLASLSISAPLLDGRPGSVDPVAFVRKLADAARIDLGGDWSTTEALARERVAKIHATGAGTVTRRDGESAPVASFASPDELWDALAAGARWTSERVDPAQQGRASLTARLDATVIERRSASATDGRTLRVVPRASRDTTHTAAVSPVLTKLYQESGLRHEPGRAAINPRTAAALGFGRARAARVLTAGGSARVTLTLDEGVMPGVVELAVAPEAVALGQPPRPGARAAIDLLVPAADGCWSSVDAEIVEG